MAKQSRKQREQTASSAIQDISYDPVTAKLSVHFMDNERGGGRIAVYGGVPQEVFDELKDAVSVGAYYNYIVRSGFKFLGYE